MGRAVGIGLGLLRLANLQAHGENVAAREMWLSRSPSCLACLVDLARGVQSRLDLGGEEPGEVLVVGLDLGEAGQSLQKVLAELRRAPVTW